MSLLKITLENMAAERAVQTILDESQGEPGSVLEDVVHAGEIARIEIAADDYDNAAEDGNNLDESLGGVIAEIERQNSLGGLSMESMALAHLALRAHGVKLSMETDHALPSMESLSEERTYVDTDYLQGLHVSMEGVFTDIGQRAAAEFIRAFNLAWVRVLRHRTRQANLAKDAAAAGGNTPSAEMITAGMKGLHRDGQAPRDMREYMFQYLRIINYMAGKFGSDGEKAAEANFNAIHRMGVTTETNPAQFDSACQNLLSSWRDPRSALPANFFYFNAPGGKRLFEDTTPNYKGRDKLTVAFDDIATKNLPTRIGSQGTGVKWDGSAAPCMSNRDIVVVSNEFLKVLQRISAPSAAAASIRSFGSIALPVVSLLAPFLSHRDARAKFAMVGAVAVAQGVRRANNTAPVIDAASQRAAARSRINAISRAVNTVYGFRLRTQIDAISNLLSVSGAFMSYAQACLAANARAAK